MKKMSVEPNSVLPDVIDGHSDPSSSSHHRLVHFWMLASLGAAVSGHEVAYGDVFQPEALSLPRWAWLLCLLAEESSPAPEGLSARALESYIPRMMLNSEGWDTVDKLPSFLT